MQDFTDGENGALGFCVGTALTLLVQPLKCWKNAAQVGRPLPLDPRVVYIGVGTSWIKEVGELGLQFGCTGMFKRLAGGVSAPEVAEVSGAIAGGVVTAPFCSVLELVLLQQQRARGGTTWSTLQSICRIHGFGTRGMLRGVVPSMVRDGIYVGGMLGATPMLRSALASWLDIPDAAASLPASLVVGTAAGVVSHPLDTIKTRMAGGDLGRSSPAAQGPLRALVFFRRLVRSAKGVTLMNGVSARTADIVIACLVSDLLSSWLPPYLRLLSSAGT